MKIRKNNTLTVAISALLLAGGHTSQIQAADDAYSSQAAPPKFTPGYESYPTPPPGGWEGVIDSIDKQSQQASDTQQQTQTTTQGYSTPTYGTSQMQQPQTMPGYSAPTYGTSQMQQPQSMQGYGTPSYGTTQMQQPQTAPGYGTSGYGSPQMQQPQTAPSAGTPAYGTSQMQQQPQAMPGAAAPAYGTTQMQQLQTMPRSSTPAYGTSQMQQPQTMRGYGTPGYGTPDYYRQPYRGRRDYGSDFSPWGGSGPSFKGPWDSGRGGSSMPWGGSRNMPWDSGRGGRSTPWGGRSMPWDSGRGGRGGFMDKDRFADSWDDMLNAPSDMGEMPGGWTAPSVSVPNPVDVGDEFGTAAEDLPTQMQNVYDDNRRSNTYDDRYDRGGYRR